MSPAFRLIQQGERGQRVVRINAGDTWQLGRLLQDECYSFRSKIDRFVTTLNVESNSLIKLPGILNEVKRQLAEALLQPRMR